METHLGEVLSIVGTVPAYVLKELSYYECLAMFSQHAFGVINFSNTWILEEIDKGIVKRCKRLPLATKALGFIMDGRGFLISPKGNEASGRFRSSVF